jgi:hypothetical protein
VTDPRVLFKLKPTDLSTGSAFDRYRAGIVEQLQKNRQFFFHWFLESQWKYFASEEKRIAYLRIEVGEEDLSERKFRKVDATKMTLEDFEDFSDAKELNPLKEWKRRKEQSGHAAIGFVFDFAVQVSPTSTVEFKVTMGLDFDKKTLLSHQEDLDRGLDWVKVHKKRSSSRSHSRRREPPKPEAVEKQKQSWYKPTKK